MKRNRTISTINRNQRGYAFATTTWESDDEGDDQNDIISPSTSSALEDIGSYTHLSVSHTGKVSHKEESGSRGRRAIRSPDADGCLESSTTLADDDHDSLLGGETAALPSSTSSSHYTDSSPSGTARRHSLLDFEFAVATFDEDGILEGEPAKASTPEEVAAARRAARQTPGQLQQEWIDNYREDYLREMIWLEGRGIPEALELYCGCGEAEDVRYRCKTCVGAEICCKKCIIQGHRRDPFHFIEQWNGNFFEHTTLKSVGLRIQLGHPTHSHCPARKDAFNDDFVVLDTTGIHEVSLDFCECESKRPYHIQLLRFQLFPGTSTSPRSAVTFRALKFFQILSFESKGSHEEFYKTVVRMTGNVDPKAVRDRYHEFLVVVSQWRHLKMLKRAGRGHDAGGVRGTGPGDCAVRCPACPQPGVNLPWNWESAKPEKSWLYRLFVAIDGNFRLRRRMVSSEERDPGLNGGWAFFVNELEYKTHLAKHWNSTQDKSTCVAHDAVDKPDRESRGLAASGVVLVMCSRHEFRLPTGIGDLQKGERYINVDFVVFSGIRWFKIREIVISYDIACQWHKKLIERLGLLPDNIQPSWISRIVYAIPKFHLPAHVDACDRTFSFNLIRGVGRSDGEAPERGWSRMNAIAKSTAEMGPGNRRDTVDNHSNDLNWEKTQFLAPLLLTKLMRALLGRERHTTGFLDIKGSIPPHFVAQWLAEVERWEADPVTAHNPYAEEVQGVSEKQIRLELAKEVEEAEKAAAEGRGGVGHDDARTDVPGGTGDGVDTKGIHPSLFVAQGLQLEDDQRKLKVALAALGNHPTAKQLATIAERSNTLRRRIALWIEIQKVHTPEAEVQRLVAQMSETAVDGKTPTETYDIPLFLPSSLPKDACTPEIRGYEVKLRIGQGYDALNDVRRYLRIRSYLYKKKDRYSRGVAQNTRSNTAIRRAQAGVDQAQSKYLTARSALVRLCGETAKSNTNEDKWRKDLLPLKKEDIRGLKEGLFGESEGSRTISWIWVKSRSCDVDAAEDDDIENDVQLQDALRVEFLRSRARAMRWSEDVELLDEEMRRTLQFFLWRWRWWMCRTRCSIPDPTGLATVGYDEGFAAYAHSQAAVYRELYEGCGRTWSKGARDAMKKAMVEVEEAMADDD